MKKLNQIANLLQGDLYGNPEIEIKSVNSLEEATEGEITFAAKDSVKTENLKASALIVKRGSTLSYPAMIAVDEPYLAFASLLELFFPSERFSEGISEKAHIEEGAVIGRNVSIGPFSYIGKDVHIDDDTEIDAGVKIYRGCKVGKACKIYSNVVLTDFTEIGNKVIIHPGAVLGADGFGFTRLADGTPVKIPQKGRVVIGNHCEIGANVCIDRSTLGKTELKEYVKLDNLVQIGHNTKVGKGTAISAQSGLSGSVEVGENVIMGGQTGVGDHIKICDGVMTAGKTGITGNITERGIFAGYPYQSIRQWRKGSAIFRNLEEYVERIRKLENKIIELEEKHGN